ncbi:MAG: flagellar export chaperone FliS [Candidatus Riflebacteria bacterium]|nr:flagellar export chaperone FliS [Candidatus Riflebacteria bacterium]
MALTQPDSYKKTQIESASPEMLILMLYDGALRFMGQAEEAFAEKNTERINNFLLRVQAIITELLASLDKEKGGEIAKNLERLYLFFLERLAESNIKKDPAPLKAIKPLIEDLRNTWAEAMKIHAKNKPATPPPTMPRFSISA